MRRRGRAALGLLLLAAGCTSLGHTPAKELRGSRPGTEITDDELQARGEWDGRDAEARRLLGSTRGQVRLATQGRALCDVVRVGRYEAVVPSLPRPLPPELPDKTPGTDFQLAAVFQYAHQIPGFVLVSSALSRVCGVSYEPRYYHLADEEAWILLRRGRPAVVVHDPRAGPTKDDVPAAAMNRLAIHMARQVQALRDEGRP